MKSESMSCFIKGDKIILRALEMADIDDGYLFWVNDLEVNQFLEVGRFPTSREQLVVHCDKTPLFPEPWQQLT